MRQILLIDDETEIHLAIHLILDPKYELTIAENAERALSIASGKTFDLVLLDVGLPDEDGFHLYPKLRALPSMVDVPVIFLTAKGEVNDRVAGFSLGADDYVVKPFEPIELLARVDARVNQRIARLQREDKVRCGRIELDRARLKAFSVETGGAKADLELTPHEFRLLNHFITHVGHVLSRDQLIDIVWGDATHVLERTIDRHVSSLRRKLDPVHEKIEAVHGVGYRFELVK